MDTPTTADPLLSLQTPDTGVRRRKRYVLEEELH